MKFLGKCKDLYICYSMFPVLFRFTHESKKMKKHFSCKDEQNDLRHSNVVKLLTS